MGGQKKFYNRWKTITEKSKLLAECKLVTSVFGRINLAIKSVSDTAFISNKSQAIMEQAIKIMFSNMNSNIRETFRKWRNTNAMERLRDTISNEKKVMVIKVINDLLSNDKSVKVRNAIMKFRLNRRIIEIKRSFLKRLLMSRAGMVVIGFKKWQALPQGRDPNEIAKANKF